VHSRPRLSQLQILFEDGIYHGAGYHLVTRPGVQRPVLKAFMSWMRSMQSS